MGFARRAICLIGFLLLSACSPDAGPEWGGTVEHLPNGKVKVTNPPEGVWAKDGQPWQLQPEVTIGELDGDEASVFGAISGLEVDDDGRIYIVDRQANELRIFAPDGSHVQSIGRTGEGPGEFTNANGLVWLTPDTLLVVDQRGNRYSVFTRGGDFVRSVRRQLGFSGWVFSGGYYARRIYETSSLSEGNDLYTLLLGTSIESDQLTGASADLSTEGESGRLMLGSVDTIRLPRWEAPLYESFSVRNDRGMMVISVPFAARAVSNLDAKGELWFGHGSTPHIYQMSLDGDTLLETQWTQSAYAVASAELDAWETSQTVEQFKEIGGKVDLDRIPKQKPYFDDIIVDPAGYVWLGVPAGPAETVFGVLDADGRYLGRLQVEGMVREFYLRPIVRNDRVYWVGRDELDVQRVYVFTITR